MPNELLRILMMLMKIEDNNVTQAAKNNSEKKEQQMSFSDYREKSVGDAQWAKMTPFPNRRRTPCLSFSSGKAPFHRWTRCQDQISLVLLGHSCATDHIYPHVGSNKCEYNNHHSSWKLFAQFDLILKFFSSGELVPSLG